MGQRSILHSPALFKPLERNAGRRFSYCVNVNSVVFACFGCLFFFFFCGLAQIQGCVSLFLLKTNDSLDLNPPCRATKMVGLGTFTSWVSWLQHMARTARTARPCGRWPMRRVGTTPTWPWPRKTPRSRRWQNAALKFPYGCGSKSNRRGKPQVLAHVSTYQGNPFW